MNNQHQGGPRLSRPEKENEPFSNNAGRVALVATENEDTTNSIPDATSASLPSADATSASLPVRKTPSKNSILVPRDNRAIILFVTVNANNRQEVFANRNSVDCIVQAWQSYGDWRVGRYMIMPDHIHFFCSPGIWPVPDFHRWMARWKAAVSRTFPVQHELPLWQRACWDTQMRTADGYREKWSYVRNNPVRKGLVHESDDWPYQGHLNILTWH